MIFTQTKLFAIFVVCGIVIGIFSDFIYATKVITHDNYIVRFVGDIALCIFSTAAVMYLFATLNGGIMRAYLIIATLIGVYLEHKTLSKLFAILFKKLYNGLKKVSKSKYLKPLFR